MVFSFNFFEPLKSKRVYPLRFKPVSMASLAIWVGVTFSDSLRVLVMAFQKILYVLLLVVSLEGVTWASLMGVTWVFIRWLVISASFPL